jgi:FlaA1/EpsC-like NDP-sugar epimerase
MKNIYTRINILPRWIIFLIDIGLCSASLVFSYLIRNNFDANKLDFTGIKVGLVLYFVINCVVFATVKTYAGIVRYTSTQDSVRILLAILLSNTAVFVSGQTIMQYEHKATIPVAVLVICSLCSFLVLISYRSLVKYCFIYFKNLKLNQRRVVIYGANQTGVTAKRTLDQQLELNMNIVAFIEDDDRKCGKVVDNIKIHPLRNLERLILSEKISDLIIADSTISSKLKNSIVDVCLNNNVKILNVPPIANWINGQFNSRQIQNIKIEDVLEREPIHINNELIDNQIHGKTILVTGAAGSIGSELVRQLLKYNPQLIILNDMAETALHDLQVELQDNLGTENFTAFIGDVRNAERMDLLFDTYNPDYVYHAAAYKHVPMMESNPSEAVNTNILGTKTVADLSMKYGVDKFVMISTDKAVNPTNVMGASKRIAEMYVQSLINAHPSGSGKLSVLYDNDNYGRTKFITTRFGNVLGSNGSVIPRFKAQIQKGGPITVTHPEITRYFMTIPEACRLVLEAGSMGSGGEIYLFDMGKSVKIVELAKKIIRLSGFIVDQDIKINFTGLRPGEKLYEELLNDSENTMPTHHEKIMIAKVRKQSYEKINRSINELLTLSQLFKDTHVVKKMKEIVPEYKSNNSIFEEFDKEVPIAVSI